MSDFYLTLPSNSSMDYYKGNSLANFTTQLPNAIDLTGDWEVGLVEIQYPHNWYNVPAEESCRTFRVRCRSGNSEDGPTAGYDFLIPAGYYHRVQTLLNQIEEKANHVLRSTNNIIQLKYEKISRKVSMESSPCRLTLPPHIRKMLGMTMVSSFASNQLKADSGGGYGSGRFSLCILRCGGTSCGGWQSGSFAQNRAGWRRSRSVGDSDLRKCALRTTSKEEFSDHRNQYKGSHRKYCAIRAGDVERDTSFPST